MTAALALALMIAPGTWLRTPVGKEKPESIELAQVAGAADTGAPDWRIEGVWHYSTEPTLRFGGFSALLSLSGGRLRAFSDRGFLFTFVEPDRAEEAPDTRRINGLPFKDQALYPLLWDIESATIDTRSKGDYWVGFENTHAIHRFSYKTEPENVRIFDGLVEDWYSNAGLEAMERLSDGRFLMLPEGRSEALIFASDPVEGGEPVVFSYQNPAPGFAVTDLAQMPDGRVLLLMRDVDWGSYPPFAGKLAIMDAPAKGLGPGSQWLVAPKVLFDFDEVLPPENYEGIAVREQDDGSVAVWILSDDNFAAMQRTLLAKLVYSPSTP